MFEILSRMARTRVRLGRLTLTAAVAMSLVAFSAIAVRSGESGPAPVSSRRYVVRAGDTLWEIARLQVGPRDDPRPLIHDIREINHLGTSALTPGVALLLP